MPLLFVLLVGDELLFGASDIGTQLGSFFGIWLIVLMTDLIASALFIVLGSQYLHAEAAA